MMNTNTFEKTCWSICLIFFLFSCNTPHPNNQDNEDEGGTAQQDLPSNHSPQEIDTLRHYWQLAEKELIQIDSIVAWNFIQYDLDGYEHLRKLNTRFKLEQLDLGNDGIKELWVQYNEYTFLYQQQSSIPMGQKGHWYRIWGTFHPIEVPTTEIVDLETGLMVAFSDRVTPECDQVGRMYHRLKGRKLENLLAVHSNYGVREMDGDINPFLEQHSNATKIAMNGTTLVIEMELSFSLIGEQVKDAQPFINENGIKLSYEWKNDTFLLKSITPKALQPYLEDWNKKLIGKEKAYYYQNPNRAVWLAYLTWKQEDLLQLPKTHPKEVTFMEEVMGESWEAYIKAFCATASFAHDDDGMCL